MSGGSNISNVTPSAEFNVWADPHAAQIVYKSGIKVIMIPLDITHMVFYK